MTRHLQVFKGLDRRMGSGHPFYVAQAFLEGDGLAFSRHAGVISAFGQHCARTGWVPAELHRYLLEAMAVRHQGDYALRPGISAGDVAEQITRAEQFFAAAERLIGAMLPPDGDKERPQRRHRRENRGAL